MEATGLTPTWFTQRRGGARPVPRQAAGGPLASQVIRFWSWLINITLDLLVRKVLGVRGLLVVTKLLPDEIVCVYVCTHVYVCVCVHARALVAQT